MEGLLAILAGAFAVAVSPLVPVMRPAAKAAVKGGLVLADVATSAAVGAAAVATGAAAAANHQWEQLRSHASAEKTAANGASTAEAVADTAVDVAPAESVPTTAAPEADATSSTEMNADNASAAPAAAVEPEAAEPEVTEPEAVEPEATQTPPADELADETNGAAPGATGSSSELLEIDGIGPKVADILTAAGFTTLAQLAAADVDQLRAVLAAAGPRYRSVNPSSWPEQASRQLEAA